MKMTRWFVCLGLVLFLAGPVVARKGKKHRWNYSQLGPTFASTINNVPKVLAIRIGDNSEAAVGLDEDLVRYTGGWTGGFVNISGGRDALLGNDRIDGRFAFQSPKIPGWYTESTDDPREKGDGKKLGGPLPHGWVRYAGHYMQGDKVVLKYRIGEATVLDHPWAQTVDGQVVFTRTVNVTGLAKPHKMVIADKKASVAISGKAKMGKGPGDCVVAEVPAGTSSFVVLVAGPDAQDALAKVAATKPKAADLSAMTKGGPRRWKQTLTTEGRLGKEEGAYAVDTITPPFKNPYKAILHFGGHDFYANGDAAICTMEGDVWRVGGIDKDLDKLTWQRIATGMYHPLGLKIVDDKVYVLCRNMIARLHDLNGDREIDYYEVFNNDIKVGTHKHEFAVCLETDPDGNFYFVKGTNGGQTSHDSSGFKVSKDGKTLTRMCTGFRWPNGMGMSKDGVWTFSDQQGTWVPSSRIDILKKGGFYGFLNSHHRKERPKTYDGPLCWIPHKVDNSSASQVWVESGGRWGPLEGKMLHLSYGRCKLFLVLQEKIGDVHQGGVVEMPIDKFQSGAMRGRFHDKDGQLYVSGLKGWQTSGARDGCFQRVRYTGKPTRLPVGLNVHKKFIKVT
ncbi:MAG: DUF6797 domain-containing protein, partial [Phycisphaeraceae bacterium]|nr:DUF6797 domain-containing protein [Phycisphaeraceae bacterium]